MGNKNGGILTEDQVLGVADPHSAAGQDRRANHQKAVDAKEKLDIDSLFAAYQKSVEDRAEYETAWVAASNVLSRDRKEKEEVDRPILAIRDIALAAINLARDVALDRSEH